ncbi:OsmC family protein [Bacillus sp. B-jedd]|uniref:OsmC family protein n=1 Tax=Bacillus sp. B-jedd TaxID=1476857 RepID=UPI0005155D75|nr:OsmC family protein [Bacillus sp. B-jedd]CEG26521.1 OsmC family protein [Bacillus sp. B-jedd]
MGQVMNFKVDGIGTGMRVDVTAGKHTIAIDEPESFGGKDSAIDPLSAFLSSLIACENVMAQIIAKEMDFHLKGISFEVTGNLDLAGLMGDPGVKPYFQEVIVRASLETSESEERIAQLQKAVDSRCPVFRTIKDAGIPIENHWIAAEKLQKI